MLSKIIIVVIFLGIVVSMGSALVFLVKDKDSPDSTRMLTSLKIRVVLSIALIAFLVLSYTLGWIPA